MGYRIDVASVGAKMRISIVGKLLAEGVGELKQAAGAIGCCLELDLSDLRFVYDDGAATLRRLIDNGAIAIGASPFIKNLLAVC